MSAAALPSKKIDSSLAGLQEKSKQGPVFLQDEYGLSHVLMTITDYERILSGTLNIVEKLWMPGMPDIYFDPPRATESAYPTDFS